MTLATDRPSENLELQKPPVPEGHVRLVIDGIEVDAPKGELVIRTAERLGIAIPRFCDHPLLDPVGACRQCLVEVEMGGRPMPKPQASCTQTVADGMVVKTQLTSPVADKAQRGNLEFLLLNHPLDCPVCDKGGECPLQNQTMSNGPGDTRLVDAKRVFTKPIPVSSEILLDRERCVLCQRCTRFSEQIAGDAFIDLLERGSKQQIGIGQDAPFQSYFSGNTIQICPVGALTSTAYRFRARPFDLISDPSVCEHCASGCAMRTDHRAGAVTRRLAGNDPEVNEEWNCDKGRFAFRYVTQPDRLTKPLIRRAGGRLEPASWTEAMTVAAEGLARARDNGGVGVLTGGRLTVTDAYAYAKFARLALRTNDIDFRARYGTAEEEAFLAARVVGQSPDDGGATYAALDSAPTVLLVALEPEEESPILFLRLRKAAREQLTVFSVAAMASRGLHKLSGTLLPAAPGGEVDVLAALAGRADVPLSTGDGPGAVIMVGERAARAPGLLTAVGELADATGARIAWVPRRAGERGALAAGALPTLLPGGRPVSDPQARADIEKAWGAGLPTAPGRDSAGILEAAAGGELGGLLIGGVDPADLPSPDVAIAAVRAAGFVVSLELRAGAITELADVVFPVAASVEKSGAYLDWEGRVRPFGVAIRKPGILDDGRVLDTLGVEMDVDLYTQSPAAAQAEIERLGRWRGAPPNAAPAGSPPARSAPAGSPAPWRHRRSDADGLRLASWRTALDGGSLLDGEPHLPGTAKADVAVMAAGTAQASGVADAAIVTVTGPAGSVTLPLRVLPDADMVADTVWLPTRMGSGPVMVALGTAVGGRVSVRAAGPAGRAEQLGSDQLGSDQRSGGGR